MRRMDSTRLNLQIGAIVATALVIAVAGGWMLSRTVRGMRLDQAAFKELCAERWRALTREIHDELHRLPDDRREAALRRCIADASYVQSGFIWAKGKGIVCSIDLPPDLATTLAPSYEWEAVGKKGGRAQRALQTLGTARHLVAWCRIPVNEVAGVVVAHSEHLPFDDPSMLYLAGGAVGAFLFIFAGACVAQIVRFARMAQREAAAKANFVSLVSHELNTPLTAIIPYADMLRRGKLASAAERQEAYETISSEAVRLKSLVAELLDFSRLERGVKKYNCADFDVGDLVRTTVRMMRERFPYGAPNVSAEGVFRVNADEDAVKAILVNLLDNAAKYACGTPVDVTVEHGGRGVRVAVGDRGPGLPHEDTAKVFERFWRADGCATASESGFGLGLAIARMYARDMGGDLSASSRPGGGAVFVLELREKADG